MSLHALLVPLLAVVQAGGGGSFGSGGGGGGSGGGGDLDGLLGLYWLVRLAFEQPCIGLPLLVVVLIVVVAGGRLGVARRQERAIGRGRPAREARAARAAADALRAADPTFDEAAFLRRAAHAWHVAQDAWCAQELDPLRRFASDGVHERFALQIDEQRRDGWRQGMDVELGELSIRHVEIGRHFETVVVRIPFSGDLHRVSLASGERIPGSSLPEDEFVELWSFLRRRGARTPSGNGLIEGFCPSCGAPIAVAQHARCAYCAALIRSGEHDFVLVEITQASAFEPEPEARVPGLEAYALRDPGISLQALEDRASVVFWRLYAARRAGDANPLRKVATAALCERLEAEMRADAASDRALLADRAVGSVRTLGVRAADPAASGARDRVLIEVCWDGRPARPAAGGALELGPKRSLRRTLLVLGRRAGETTRVEHAFDATCCATCGAADDGGLAPACPYCDAPRIGDASAWLCEDVLAIGSPEARLLLLADDVPGAPPSAERLFAWAAALAGAEGGIDARERRALEALARRLAIPDSRAEALIAAPADPEAELPAPSGRAEAEAWLAALSELALADGAIGDRERRVLERVNANLGRRRGDLRRTLGGARRELHRATRRARSS